MVEYPIKPRPDRERRCPTCNKIIATPGKAYWIVNADRYFCRCDWKPGFYRPPRRQQSLCSIS